MARHNQTGKEGEQAASEYLTARGYTIRETNWRSGKYELDIVAQKNGILVVIEVKTRRSERFEYPEEAVTSAKIRRIVEATDAYIRRYDILFETRFDIMTLIGNPESGYRISHLEDAFYSPL